MNIAYINTEEELEKLHVGQEAYYKEKFFTVHRLRKLESNSATCPCVTAPCAFNRVRLSVKSYICPFFAYCSATNRHDGTSVVFEEIKVTGDKLSRFKSWCRTNEKHFTDGKDSK